MVVQLSGEGILLPNLNQIFQPLDLLAMSRNREGGTDLGNLELLKTRLAHQL